MSEPSIDPGLWERAANWLWAALVAAGSFILHTFGGRIRRIEANIHELRNRMPSDYERAEINRQRDNVAELFKQLKAHAERDEDMHNDIMRAISGNHSEVLRELSRKADK